MEHRLVFDRVVWMYATIRSRSWCYKFELPEAEGWIGSSRGGGYRWGRPNQTEPIPAWISENSDLATWYPPWVWWKNRGTITWARTVPEGRRYHSQIGKLVEKAKAPLLPDLENFATARTIHTPTRSGSDSITTLSCSLARSRFTRSTCAPLALQANPCHLGLLNPDLCVPIGVYH